jgi:hypothetical protein
MYARHQSYLGIVMECCMNDITIVPDTTAIHTMAQSVTEKK